MKRRRHAWAALLLLLWAIGSPIWASAEADPKTKAEAAAKAPATASSQAQGLERTEAERLAAEAERLDEIAAGGQHPSEPVDLTASIVRMVLVFGFVALLAYLLLGKLLPRLLKIPAMRAPRGLGEVVDRMPIDAQRSLMVVKMTDRYFFLGMTEHSIQLLAELDPEALEAAFTEVPEAKPTPRWLRFFFQDKQG